MAVSSGERALESIFAFDQRIRTFSIVSKHGKIIFAKMRQGLESFAPKETMNLYSARIALLAAINETEDHDHGKVRFSVVKREKIMIITFPGTFKVYIISATPNFPLDKIEDFGLLMDLLTADLEQLEVTSER